MTRDELKLDLKKWGAILAVVGGLLVVASALRAYGDERYALKSDAERIEGKLDRVLDVACSNNPTHRACRP